MSQEDIRGLKITVTLPIGVAEKVELVLWDAWNQVDKIYQDAPCFMIPNLWEPLLNQIRYARDRIQYQIDQARKSKGDDDHISSCVEKVFTELKTNQDSDILDVVRTIADTEPCNYAILLEHCLKITYKAFKKSTDRAKA